VDLGCIVVIPVYNSKDTILELIKRIQSSSSVDFIFINDGSFDGTESILKENSLPYLEHIHNRGKGRALQTGIQYASKKGYEYVLTLDADLQHPPELIPELLKMAKKTTVVIGWRSNYSLMPLHRIFSNLVTSLLISLRTRTQVRDSQCGFRLFPISILRDIKIEETGFQFESEFLIKSILANYKIQHVRIPTIYQDEKTAIRNVWDTFRFVNLYFRSFFW